MIGNLEVLSPFSTHTSLVTCSVGEEDHLQGPTTEKGKEKEHRVGNKRHYG